MPDFTLMQALLMTLAVIAGLLSGWYLRGKRVRHEKASINAGWKEQIEAQRIEHKRLIDQNQSLMEQVSQFQASGKDATNRAKELSSALKEAFERRDHLQREIKDVRSNLDSVLAERRKLESDLKSLAENDSLLHAAVREKDDKIFKLSRELEAWQNRLPPLIQRYRERDEDAKRLESELDRVRERILELETGRNSEQTHVETVDRRTIAESLNASNDADNERSGIFAAAAAATEVNGTGYGEGQDDLKEIKGVGPAIEKTLHELGFFRFRQIAEMSEYDINRIAEHLKGFRSRIYREDWIGQARDLELRRTTH